MLSSLFRSWLPTRNPATPRPAPPPHRWRPSLTRLEDRDNPSGGLDLSFSGDGKQTLNPGTTDQATTVLVQPDGKILVAGTEWIGSGPDFSVARYNPNGTLDTTFSGDGRQLVFFGLSASATSDFCTGMALQADGNIVLVGYSNVNTGDVNDNDFAVIRLTSAGELDTTFDTDGRATFSLAGDNRASAVAVQSDGRIIVVGSEFIASSGANIAVLRLNSNGSLHTTFDSDGRVGVDVGAEDICTGVALQADGKIVVVGYTNFAASGANDVAVVRLTTSGALDTSFDGDGMKTINFNLAYDDRASGVVIQPDGNIVIATSWGFGQSSDFALIRLTPIGNLDDSFDTDGKVSTSFGSEDVTTGLALQPDGRIVVSGYTNGSGNNNFAVARFKSNGALDTSFSGDGIQTVDFGGDDRANGVALQKDGKIVLAGQTGNDFAVARLIGRDTDLIGRESSGNWWLNHSTGSAFSVSNSSYWVEGGAWRDVNSGDVNGDGLSDMIGRTSDGHWWVSRSNGDGTFNFMHFAVWNEAAGWKDVTVGDFNGDGKSDVAGRDGAGNWWVGLSNGSAFVTSHWVKWNEAAGWKDVRFADFNGDGKTDVAGRTSDGNWWVGRSTGTTFNTSHWVKWNEAAGWKDVQTGDFNGDGNADIAGRTAFGNWFVSYSNGTSFNSTTNFVNWNEAAGWKDVRFADFNGDGRTDIAGRDSGGNWWVSLSNGATASSTTVWVNWNELAGWKDVRVGDFNGDGLMDIASRTADGTWYVSRSNGTVFNATSNWTAWNETAGWKDVLLGSFVG